MTNAGGTIALSIAGSTFEANCNPLCIGGSAPFRLMTGGSITTAVPEPGTLALLGAGLLGIWFRKRAA